MNELAVERLVRALLVCLMNGLLYFPAHRRVKESAEDAVRELDDYFDGHPEMAFHVREGLIVFEGTPFYDLSIHAHRLIRALKDHGACGLRFEPGVTEEEIIALVELLLGPNLDSAAESNLRLRAAGAEKVALTDEAPVERGLGREGDGTEGFSTEEEILCEELYTGTLSLLQDVMVELRRGKKPSLDPLNEMAESLAEGVRSHRDAFVSLTAVKDYDIYAFNHSVNVCIYTAGVAEFIIDDPATVVRIAQAALLHDVGKLLIPDEILHKPGALSPEERKIMEQHTLLGAKILMEAEGDHELAVNVAFGHHLRYDGKGYPEVAEGMEIDPVTRLVQVVDFYEAVTARRAYKDPFTSEYAVKLMLEKAGTFLDPACVHAFIRCFGVYPTHTTVRLRDGRIGRVVRSTRDDPFHPLVRVTRDAEGNPLEEALLVDTGEKDETGAFLHPVAESLVREPAAGRLHDLSTAGK